MIGEERPKMPHNVTLKDRRHLTISGVSEIISFDENGVSLDIQDSQLNIDGGDLRIESFSTDGGEVCISGCVDSIIYAGKTEASYRRGILKRLFSYDT